MNKTVINLNQQIEGQKEALKKLKEVQEYLYENFAAKQSEQDAIGDIIAQVKDRHEMRIRELKGEILDAL